jgi:hypothetical protein
MRDKRRATNTQKERERRSGGIMNSSSNHFNYIPFRQYIMERMKAGKWRETVIAPENFLANNRGMCFSLISANLYFLLLLFLAEKKIFPFRSFIFHFAQLNFNWAIKFLVLALHNVNYCCAFVPH